MAEESFMVTKLIFIMLFIALFVLTLLVIVINKLSYAGCMGTTVNDVKIFTGHLRQVTSTPQKFPIILKDCIDRVIISNELYNVLYKNVKVKCKTGDYSYIAVYKKDFGFWSSLAFWDRPIDKYISKDSYCESLKNVEFNMGNYKNIVLKGPSKKGDVVIYCLTYTVTKTPAGKTIINLDKPEIVVSEGECR